jgi:hypothetical protein
MVYFSGVRDRRSEISDQRSEVSVRDQRFSELELREQLFFSIPLCLVSFWENLLVSNYPPPTPRSIGIIDLAENCEIIYGVQQLTGKIQETQELGSYFPILPTRLRELRMLYKACGRQGHPSH